MFTDYGFPLEEVSALGLLEPIEPLDLSDKKIGFLSTTQKILDLYNSIGMCNFTSVPIGFQSLKNLVSLVEAVTGWNTSLFELIKVGEKG